MNGGEKTCFAAFSVGKNEEKLGLSPLPFANFKKGGKDEGSAIGRTREMVRKRDQKEKKDRTGTNPSSTQKEEERLAGPFSLVTIKGKKEETILKEQGLRHRGGASFATRN